MSISIGHRSIFTAFGHRSSSAVGLAHIPSAPAPLPAAEIAGSFEAGELRCSPWEGLYLEQARPVAPAGTGGSTGRELEAFLTGLMYGE